MHLRRLKALLWIPSQNQVKVPMTDFGSFPGLREKIFSQGVQKVNSPLSWDIPSSAGYSLCATPDVIP